MGLSGDGRGDGFERGFGFAAVGPARLRHVGTTAAALAAQRLGALFHEHDRIEARGQIGSDADHDTGPALLMYPDAGDDAGADLLLALLGKTFLVLRLDAG